MTPTIYPPGTGGSTAALTDSYTAGTSALLTVDTGATLPDAPNIVTITGTDTSRYVVVRYDTKAGNILSGLTVLTGVPTASQTFPAGSPVSREITGAEWDAIREHLDARGNPHGLTLSSLGAAAAVHAAAHSPDGADPLTPAALGAAEAVHASSHASDGADSLTPAAIGAAPAGHTHSGFAANIHAGQHAAGGSDELTPADIRAAAADHTHTGYASAVHAGRHASGGADAIVPAAIGAPTLDEMTAALAKKAGTAPASADTAGLMTPADKTKLDGISTGAEVNTITAVRLNGVTLPVTDKAIDITVTSGTTTADVVTYNNSASGLAAVSVQDAVDEIAAVSTTPAAPAVRLSPAIDGLGDNVQTALTALNNRPSGGQTQSDWAVTDTTDPAFIKNKPAVSEGVQSDWTVTDAANPAFIKNKPALTVDTTLSADSVNPVENRAVHAAVIELETAVAGKEPVIARNTAFNKNFSVTAPVMNGTASAGSASTVARADHVHPTDTTRAAAADLTALTSQVTAALSHATDTGNPHHVTAVQTGAAPASHATDTGNPHRVTAAQTGAAPASHITDTGNPHHVTAVQTGAAPASHATDTDNPHQVTAAQTGAPTLAEMTAALADKLDTTASAASADRLSAARTINGIPFDGTADVTIPAVISPTLLCPAGAIVSYLGASAPEGWLICSGQSLEKTAYPSLYTVLGDTYGGTATAFNLPDLRGRFLTGADATAALGSTGGAAAVTLNINQIPSHNHGGTVGSSGNHGHTVSITNGGAHTHSVTLNCNLKLASGGNGLEVGGGGYMISSTSTSSGDHSHAASAVNGGDHQHSITANGSGQSHENRPPYFAVNWIIKT